MSWSSLSTQVSALRLGTDVPILYHAGSSVCSQKVRLALAETGLDWESRNLDMGKGEHQTPAYLALNPEGVVPTLVTDQGAVIRESSVIVEYVDQIGGGRLMPGGAAQWQTRIWLIRCIEIHGAINTLSFATAFRRMLTGAMTPEALEDWLARVPNPEARQKRRDLLAKGATSAHVGGALTVMDHVFRDISDAMKRGPWLCGPDFGLADCALLAYVDRLRALGLDGLYQGRFAGVGDWLERARARPSYDLAVTSWQTPAQLSEWRAAGTEAWPVIAAQLR